MVRRRFYLQVYIHQIEPSIESSVYLEFVLYKGTAMRSTITKTKWYEEVFICKSLLTNLILP